MKTQTLSLLLAGVILMAPALAGADEGVNRNSYSNKKSGQVAFKPAYDEAVEGVAASDKVDPAAIEPAAGAEVEAMPEDDKNSLADDMKLPRKN